MLTHTAPSTTRPISACLVDPELLGNHAFETV